VSTAQTLEADETTRSRVMNALFLAIPDCLFAKDREGRYILLNAASTAVAEYAGRLPPDSDLTGLTANDVFPPKLAQRVLETDDIALNGGVSSFEARIPSATQNGEGRWFLVSKAPLHDDAGQIVGIIGIAKDITAQKRTEQTIAEEKERADRQREAVARFLSVTAHDLRQPLQAVQFYTTALAPSVPPEAWPLFSKLEVAQATVNSLFETLLDATRLDTGIFNAQLEEFAASEVLDQVATATGRLAEAKGLKAHYLPSDAIIRSDRAMLTRLFMNLTENAVRYTTTGRVIIDCIEREDRLLVEIRDSGIGIPPERLARIWEESRNPESGGLGLGLTMVRRIADILDLNVQIKSDLGHGTTCIVSLPLVARGIDETDAATAAFLARGHRPDSASPVEGEPSVLVVDDDAILRDAFDVVLSEVGLSVTAVGTYPEAAKAVIQSEPDVMIIDYRLIGITGVEIYQRLCGSLGRKVPAILLTGEISDEVRRLAAENGMRLMHKPIITANLIAAVRELAKQD